MAELHELAHLLTTPRDLIRWGASRFNEAQLCFGHGTDNALDEAASLVLQALDLPLDLAPVFMEGVLTNDERVSVLRLLTRRIEERVPVPYLTGRAWFAGLEFIVNPNVLIPRSPIGELVLNEFLPWCSEPPRRILDLCTGGGCIAVACAHMFPEAQVDAADLSADALAVAQQNIDKYGLNDRMRVLQGDLFEAVGDAGYDLIVSNPPYVSSDEYGGLPQEFMWEPKSALATGEDGLDLVERMLQDAPDHLTPDGILVCEVGATAPALVAKRPDLPFTWPHFEHGGDGVFVLTRGQLIEGRS